MGKRAWAVVIVLSLLVGACALLRASGIVIQGPILNSLLGQGIEAPESEVVKKRIQTIPGFQATLWADGIPNARFMRFSPGGALLVSQPRLGTIVEVFADRDGDGRSDGKRAVLSDLDRPHGLDFREGALYIGEGSAIARVAYTERPGESGSLVIQGDVARIATGIPSGGNHWARTLRFGPDGGLYLSVGSSCNVCEEKDPRRAAMLRFNADGSGEEIFASGLRNSTGFDWRPGTNELFATDNGRDLLGDDYPPCELNRIVRGGFYGWPYANGNRDVDPDFGPGNQARIDASIPPVHPFRAHNAPLGISFVRHANAAPSLRGAALVALHGSWNRSELDGYKVVSLHWDENDAIRERDFLWGFQQGEDVIGRPVDVAEGPDGAFYVSDDYAGVIYRVARAEAGLPSEAGADPASGLSTARTDPNLPLAVDDPLAALATDERRDLARRGEAVFGKHPCGSCHLTAEAVPGMVTKPIEGLTRKYTVESLTAYFLTPQPPMPVFELSAEERRALAVYLLENFGPDT